MLSIGGIRQFSATGTYSDGTTKDLTASATWSSSNSSVAQINAAGLLTATGAGSATVLASFNAVSGASSVSVSSNTAGITIAPATPSIELNTTQALTASESFSDGTQQDVTKLVTWTSSDVTKATIDATGLVTAVASGSTTITAAFNGLTGTTVLTVDPPALASIIVDQDGSTVPLGLPQQLTATGVFNDGSTASLLGVSFTSSDPTIVSVDVNGVATTNAVGSVTITATLGSVSGTGILTVGPQTLTSMAVTPTNPSVPLNFQQQFVATGTFTDSSTQQLTTGVVWSSSDTTVATVDQNGLATSVGVGTATITATSGTFSSSGSLTVTAANLVSIAVTPTSVSIPVAVTQQFTATGSYDDTSTQDLSSVAIWVSSNGGLATISNSGVATGLAPGNLNVTASMGSISGTAALQINTATISSLSISPANSTVAKGTWLNFTLTGQYSDGSTRAITSGISWHTSKPSIAHINGAGRARAHKKGTVTISAAFHGVTTTTTLTVN
jgi:uncharacterized protein YjdB